MRFSSSQQGSVTLFQIEGAMTQSSLDSLSTALSTRVANGQPRLMLDLSAVSAMDSATLELLVDTQQECRRKGGVVKLTGLNPLLAEVLRITGLERHFEVFDNQLTALGSFAT